MDTSTVFAAARRGDVRAVEEILETAPELLHARGHQGVTLLHVAAERDDASMAVMLLDAGAAVEAESGWGQTPFEWAANMGSTRVARLLLERGAARLNLWTASALGMLEEVRGRFRSGLLRAGAGREPPPGADLKGWPEDSAYLAGDAVSDAFYIACRNGHVHVADFLLSRGAQVDARGFFGGTGLHWAAINGHAAMVGWLMGKGADTRLRDVRFKATPGGWAREGGHEEIARLLESGSGEA